jgi:hypothetical protein
MMDGKCLEIEKMATERWNDQMLDELAVTVREVSATVGELSVTVGELSVRVKEVSVTLDRVVLVIAAQDRKFEALIDAISTQQGVLTMMSNESQRDRRIAQERYEEQNQRFNILLEEVRATNRRVTNLEERS